LELPLKQCFKDQRRESQLQNLVSSDLLHVIITQTGNPRLFLQDFEVNGSEYGKLVKTTKPYPSLDRVSEARRAWADILTPRRACAEPK
jgi:hypothetical protein